jgi:hypothetical protein
VVFLVESWEVSLLGRSAAEELVVFMELGRVV